jgi:peptidoglycan hydrolase-like protein with peptidoglycan-binding domain
MRAVLAILLLLCGLAAPLGAHAQERIWLQIEAQPTRSEALERAGAWAAIFPDTAGFALTSGWFAIALGPYDAEGAVERMRALKAENLIPRDSYVTDGATYRAPFWPPEGQQPAAQPDNQPDPAALAALPEPEPEPQADPTAPPPPQDETPDQARRSEAALTAEERTALQDALSWFGFYDGALDGAFGRGTRASMADWQQANALEPTGILTALQRATLLANWQADRAEYGFRTVTETEAGIEITLPLGLVAFDHYEPPFVHFAETGTSGLRVILISQPGDQAALYGLYDVLQTLEVMPLTGERSRSEGGFSLSGQNATVAARAEVTLSRGLIKGWMLVWDPARDAAVPRVLAAMEQSFRAIGDRALDPGLVPLAEDTRAGLLSGLEVRRPRLSRSGFFIDAAGSVLTTAEAVQGCTRLSLDAGSDAVVTFQDQILAVLTPEQPLAPQAVAEFQLAPDRIGAEVALAGYPYEDQLPAPVLTFGTLEALDGLDGETGVKRLGLTARAGDAGGPVVDGTGAVLGMLLPRDAGAARQLPPEVAYLASGADLAARLQAAGITLRTAPRSGALAPEDLAAQATGMTVLVSCWD